MEASIRTQQAPDQDPCLAPVHTIPTPSATDEPVAAPTRVGHGVVGIVGLGYVGLPTALGLHAAGATSIGIELNAERLQTIRSGLADLVPEDRVKLSAALADQNFQLTTNLERLSEPDTVVVCVPTPIDHHLNPDLGPLKAACHTVVQHARRGQTLVLTSTSYVGCTEQLLAEPLRNRGFSVGKDIFVAFSPERIDPGNSQHTQRDTPRVLGGITLACAERAKTILRLLTPVVHTVSSAEAAELTKLYENSFRAVNIALANEFAEVCGTLALDPIEITTAAATKPYGFLAFYPGPGVGGHCIPCDPHYLLWQLRKQRRGAPIIQQAMTAIAQRPKLIADRATETLSDAGQGMSGARVVMVGVTYKPGVADVRESSALWIIAELQARGAKVDYYDPLMDNLLLPNGQRLDSIVEFDWQDWDLAIVHTLHPQYDYAWVANCPTILDATYGFTSAAHRVLP